MISEEAFLILSVGRKIMTVDPTVSSVLLPTVAPDMQRMRMYDKEGYKRFQKAAKEMERYRKVFSYFDDRLRSIEVVWAGRGLFQVHFVLPRECQFISEELKQRIKDSFDISDDDRVRTFVSKARLMHWDMQQKMIYANNNMQVLLLFQDELLYAITALSVVINFIIIISLEKGYFTGYETPQFTSSGAKFGLRILVLIQFILVLSKLCQVALVRIPLIIRGKCIW
jgi:hypothetical protein